MKKLLVLIVILFISGCCNCCPPKDFNNDKFEDYVPWWGTNAVMTNRVSNFALTNSLTYFEGNYVF